MSIHFTKMQAYGNDYVYVDAFHQAVQNPGDLAQKISNRHFGVGSDGLVLICPSKDCDFRMRIFNPDGTEAQMCGNALRSAGMLAYEKGLVKKELLTVETLGGRQRVQLELKGGQVANIRAAIGKPRLMASSVPVQTEKEQFINQPLEILGTTLYASSISWGNPHTVVTVEDVEHFPVEKYGPALERAGCFPERTNVTFVEVLDERRLKIREWERGTGETLGCGTGCCAALVVMHLLGRCQRSVTVEQPGGVLAAAWDDEGVVHMRGPSHVVCEGEYFDEAERTVV